jgi:hypothetical protein
MNDTQKAPVQTLELAPVRAARVSPLAGLAALGMIALSTALADDASTSLAAAATGSMGGTVAAVITVLLIGIGIKVLWFSNKQVKTGIGAAK